MTGLEISREVSITFLARGSSSHLSLRRQVVRVKAARLSSQCAVPGVTCWRKHEFWRTHLSVSRRNDPHYSQVAERKDVTNQAHVRSQWNIKRWCSGRSQQRKSSGGRKGHIVKRFLALSCLFSGFSTGNLTDFQLCFFFLIADIVWQEICISLRKKVNENVIIDLCVLWN